MANRGWASILVLFAIILLASMPRAQTPSANPPANGAAAKGGDLELVKNLINIRRDYQKSLEALRLHYFQVGDVEKMRWAEDELLHYHRIPKQAFILDLDVPPSNLNSHQNVPEANKMFTWAMQFKDKGWGNDYLDNQRRAELLFQEILTKYPHSDKISDVAYMLGDIYESKVYRQYKRAAEYYQRCFQWNPKTTHDARMRAARLFDRQLNQRNKAIDLYREVTTHETDPRRIQEAQKRLAELSAPR